MFDQYYQNTLRIVMFSTFDCKALAEGLFDKIINNFMVDLYEKPDQQRINAVETILRYLQNLDLSRIQKPQRILLIDTAIKIGNVQLVKAIADKFQAKGFSDDIRIPYAEHLEHPYRPVFWLAAVTTGFETTPAENYVQIEKYLCEKFGIPDSVVINGNPITRDEYVQAVTEWKRGENIRLREGGRDGDDRYPINNGLSEKVGCFKNK